MTLRTARPSALQSMNIPTIVIHYAEPVSGLTPRTPYFHNPAEEVANQHKDGVPMMYLSPNTFITPAMPRRSRNKPVMRTPAKIQPQPAGSWCGITWLAMFALFVLALWSQRLCKVENHPRTPTLHDTYNNKPMEWVTVKPHRASATPAVHSMQAMAIVHPTEARGSSQIS